MEIKLKRRCVFVEPDVQKLLENLKGCHTGDPEVDHYNADEALLDFFVQVGFPEVKEEFRKTKMWYA